MFFGPLLSLAPLSLKKSILEACRSLAESSGRSYAGQLRERGEPRARDAERQAVQSPRGKGPGLGAGLGVQGRLLSRILVADL